MEKRLSELETRLTSLTDELAKMKIALQLLAFEVTLLDDTIDELINKIEDENVN